MADIDATASAYVRNTRLTSEAHFKDLWPGVADWFLHYDDDPPEVLPPVYRTVQYAVETRFALQSGLPRHEIEALIFDERHDSLAKSTRGAEHGTFLLRRRVKIP